MTRRISSSRLYRLTVDEYLSQAQQRREADSATAARNRAAAECISESDEDDGDGLDEERLLEERHYGDDEDRMGWDDQ